MTKLILRPNPLFFIKSISEQGYKLETALADLIDNSITANATEINIFSSTIDDKSCIMIADNGNGMKKDDLISALRMPSQSMENKRNSKDLGRFGLGLKTASFSQSRRFTVLSKDSEQDKYHGYCWDINNLSEDWLLQELNKSQIDQYLKIFFEKKQKSLIDSTSSANTVIIWEELFKSNNTDELNKQLNFEVKEHLSLVFHRFLDENKIKLTIGNMDLLGFNPFPEEMPRLQLYRFFHNGTFNVQGFTLPYGVLNPKSDINKNEWVMPGKNLSDMEGIYLYREDRLIYFGGWAKLIGRQQYLKLGRLKIEIKNTHDDLFQINVAKSTMQIPKEFLVQLREIVSDLADQSKSVYYQRQPNQNKIHPIKNEFQSVLHKVVNEKGVFFNYNKEHKILKELLGELPTKYHKKLLNIYLGSIVNKLNKYVNIDNGNVEDAAEEHNNEILSQQQILELKAKGFTDEELMDLFKIEWI